MIEFGHCLIVELISVDQFVYYALSILLLIFTYITLFFKSRFLLPCHHRTVLHRIVPIPLTLATFVATLETLEVAHSQRVAIFKGI
jgi:hypothetical protein